MKPVAEQPQPEFWGILNLTPDSFSDGDPQATTETFLARARDLLDEGTHVLDIGAESTRPGAMSVSVADEVRRLAPFLEKFRLAYPKARLSLDTRKIEVFSQLQGFGFEFVNDTSGLADIRLAEAAARAGSKYVLMHSRGEPQQMMEQTNYGLDFFTTYFSEIQNALKRLDAAGLKRDDIILDPGFGFAKTPAQCVLLWENLARFVRFVADAGFSLPEALLLGISRKRFLENFVGPSRPSERDSVTAEMSIAAWRLGFGRHRIHNVKLTKQRFSS